MQQIDVNVLAVLAAAIVNMVIGFLWYSPLILGNPWMKLMGYTAESLKKAQQQMGALYGLSFVVALITGYVLAHVIGLSQNFYGYTGVMAGFSSAFWMWLGFILPVQVTGTIFTKGKPQWQLLAINTGYQLVATLAMGLVIGLL